MEHCSQPDFVTHFLATNPAKYSTAEASNVSSFIYDASITISLILMNGSWSLSSSSVLVIMLLDVAKSTFNVLISSVKHKISSSSSKQFVD